MKNTCYSRFETRPQEKNKVVWWECFWKVWCKLKTTLPSEKIIFPLLPAVKFTASMTICSPFNKQWRNIWICWQTRSPSINSWGRSDLALFAFGWRGKGFVPHRPLSPKLRHTRGWISLPGHAKTNCLPRLIFQISPLSGYVAVVTWYTQIVNKGKCETALCEHKAWRNLS